ncbi:MAG: EamA family transporter [Candidatus Coatesbacteria bacterium]|nr:EamA family transporter [Candidatus Coatesbacteria bacterium]
MLNGIDILNHKGEYLSFLAAIFWAIAIIFFKKSGEKVHPIALNIFKNSFSFILFIFTILIMKEELLINLPLRDYIMLMISGVMGIAIGDTLFFKSLNYLGAGLSSIVICLYSPFVIVFSILLLHERLTFLQIIAALLIISAIFTATSLKNGNQSVQRHIVKGIILGALSNASNALGIVMIKPLLNNIPILFATEVRLLGGLIALSIILLFMGNRKEIISSLKIREGIIYTISGSFVGAYLAMMTWISGMKYTQASIASLLNQTSNVFIFIFAAIFLKEKINTKRVTGLVMAVIGVIILTLF